MLKKTSDHYEVTPALIRKCEKLAAKGLSIIQIGLSLGWSEETIHKKKRENPELAESIKRGQAQGIETVANALYNNAVGFDYEEVHEEIKKGEDGKTITHTKTVKKCFLPNPTSQIFYLKNRDPEHWRDKFDHTVSGDIILKIDKDDEEL